MDPSVKAINIGVENQYTVVRVSRSSKPAKRGDMAVRTKYGTGAAMSAYPLSLDAPKEWVGVFVADAAPGASARVQVYGYFIP